jgi:predicted LPLAT superfamily acyltransferase
MPLWQGKSRGTPFGYRIFVAILKNFGVLPAYTLLRVVALYYFLFLYKSSRPLYYYFRHRLGYPVLKSLASIYRNFYLFGQTIIDKVVVMSGISNRFTFDFDGEENLKEIVALQQGGLLLSAHIGNWEVAGHLLKRLNTRIHVVMFDNEHQQIKDYLSTITGKRNVNVIVVRNNDISHIYEITEAFKNNELVCMHADRFIEGNKILSTNFLGEKARFPMGPFVLAATFKVPVSYVFAMKESNFHYHFFASEIKNYHHLSKENRMRQMLEDYAAEMEKKVKQYPVQWYNYYNFWQQ